MFRVGVGRGGLREKFGEYACGVPLVGRRAGLAHRVHGP